MKIKMKIFSYILPIIISIVFFEVVLSPFILNNNSNNDTSDTTAYNIKKVINSPNSVPIQQKLPSVYEKSIKNVSLIYRFK